MSDTEYKTYFTESEILAFQKETEKNEVVILRESKTATISFGKTKSKLVQIGDSNHIVWIPKSEADELARTGEITDAIQATLDKSNIGWEYFAEVNRNLQMYHTNSQYEGYINDKSKNINKSNSVESINIGKMVRFEAYHAIFQAEITKKEKGRAAQTFLADVKIPNGNLKLNDDGTYNVMKFVAYQSLGKALSAADSAYLSPGNTYKIESGLNSSSPQHEFNKLFIGDGIKQRMEQGGCPFKTSRRAEAIKTENVKAFQAQQLSQSKSEEKDISLAKGKSRGV